MTKTQHPISLLVGLLLIGAGSFDTARTSLPPNAAARVNDTLITHKQLAAAAEQVYSGDDNATFNHQAAELLPKFIEQELLLQRAIEVNLVASDPKIRQAIVNAVMAETTAAARSSVPSDGQLQQYHQENPGLFESPARVQLQQIFFRHNGDDSADRDRAQQAMALLQQGVNFEYVREQLGDAEVTPLPRGLIPIPHLARLFPLELLTKIQETKVNTITEPLQSRQGTHILRINARSQAQLKPFTQVARAVATHYQRQRQVSALNDRLKALWNQANIVLADQTQDPFLQ